LPRAFAAQQSICLTCVAYMHSPLGVSGLTLVLSKYSTRIDMGLP
jgi:hypothetical protein